MAWDVFTFETPAGFYHVAIRRTRDRATFPGDTRADAVALARAHLGPNARLKDAAPVKHERLSLDFEELAIAKGWGWVAKVARKNRPGGGGPPGR